MAEGVITAIGREKLCKAHAGEKALPKIAKMAFGDGGLDSSGNVIPTTGNETALKKQLLVKNIDGYTFPIATTASYACTLEKNELADKDISEQGLIDDEGDLVAYKTFLGKGKDGDMKFIFNMEEIF